MKQRKKQIKTKRKEENKMKITKKTGERKKHGKKERYINISEGKPCEK